MLITCLTAGQRTAVRDLRDALRAHKPLILLFGGTGSGKTSVIDDLLRGAEADALVPVSLSATGGDILGPPTFELLLESICKRLNVSASPDNRPASLASLANVVAALIKDGKTIVLAVDHADRLSDDVIVDLARLHDYLDVAATALARIFVGSVDLASRIDTILRRIGAEQRLSEIRLSQPTAEEVASVLAYEDSARPGGPMLTPDAIERISAYAKSNLHWAVPMADAACALAESEGAREVTPDLVREALLDIWSPEHDAAPEHTVPNDLALGNDQPDRRASTHRAAASAGPGLSDSADYPAAIGKATARRAPRRNRRRLALGAGVGILALLMGLTAAFFLGRHEEDIARRLEGPTPDPALSRQIQSPPLSPENANNMSPAPVTPASEAIGGQAKDQGQGAYGPGLTNDTSPLNQGSHPEPISEPSLEAGSGLPADDAKPTATATMPTTAGAPTASAPIVGAPKPKSPDVMPTPKRPEEKTPNSWLQVR